MNIRPAKISDVPFIEELIQSYAKEMLLLPRTRLSIIESLPVFRVAEEDGQLLGCGALHVLWDDLAEMRSLAVVREARGKGVGTALVQHFLKMAEELGIRRVFALTYEQRFFARNQFLVVDKNTLPQKVWKDCINCPKLTSCDEVAMLHVIEKVSPLERPLLEKPNWPIPMVEQKSSAFVNS